MAYEYLDEYTDDLFAEWQLHDLRKEQASDPRTRIRESHYAEQILDDLIHFYRVVLRKPRYVSQRHNFQQQLKDFAPIRYRVCFSENGRWRV